APPPPEVGAGPPAAPAGARRYWYVACLARDLRRRPVARTVLGVPLVLFRDGHGRPAALLDRCAHRNVPLSLGRCRDGVVECAYHGWRFDGGGACRAVPGLGGDDPDRPSRRVDAFPVFERDGLVWVVPTPRGPGDATLPGGGPPAMPHVDDAGY